MYRLKKNQPPFSPTMGKFSGWLFTHGESYREIPAEEKSRFERVKPATTKKTEEASK